MFHDFGLLEKACWVVSCKPVKLDDCVLPTEVSDTTGMAKESERVAQLNSGTVGSHRGLQLQR